MKGNVILTDSTHIKAHASRKSEIKVMVEKESSEYLELLDYYEDRERAELERTGMKPKRRNPNTQDFKEDKKVEKIISRTDPEAGFMKRGTKPLGIYYLSHQSTDSEYRIFVDVKSL